MLLACRICTGCCFNVSWRAAYRWRLDRSRMLTEIRDVDYGSYAKISTTKLRKSYDRCNLRPILRKTYEVVRQRSKITVLVFLRITKTLWNSY